MRLNPGQRVLDRYVVESRIGAGGMGEVYKARHERLDMPVALKVLTVDATEEYLRRFEQEAKMMARIRHPNVVSILDFGLIDDSAPCIAMELVKGEPLSPTTCGAQPWREAVAIILDVLAGLGAIHEADFLHRDLKPSNILVCEGNEAVAKLIDFGISKSMAADVTQLTRTGLLIGTPPYMPPEQILGSPLDPRSDLYSATLVLFQLVTGSQAFDGANYLLDRIVQQAPQAVAPSDLEPLPQGLQAAIADGLALDPDDRPANVGDLARRLRRLLDDSPAIPSPEVADGPKTDILETPPALFPDPNAAAVQDPDGSFQTPAPEVCNRFLIVARLPPSRLADATERRWLADLTRAAGRGYSLGSQFWFALQTAATQKQATDQARATAAALTKRYGSVGKIDWRLVGDDFSLSPAQITGGEPFPSELQAMLDEMI